MPIGKSKSTKGGQKFFKINDSSQSYIHDSSHNNLMVRDKYNIKSTTQDNFMTSSDLHIKSKPSNLKYVDEEKSFNFDQVNRFLNEPSESNIVEDSLEGPLQNVNMGFYKTDYQVKPASAPDYNSTHVYRNSSAMPKDKMVKPNFKTNNYLNKENKNDFIEYGSHGKGPAKFPLKNGRMKGIQQSKTSIQQTELLEDLVGLPAFQDQFGGTMHEFGGNTILPPNIIHDIESGSKNS
jgi:hypothetical protein